MNRPFTKGGSVDDSFKSVSIFSEKLLVERLPLRLSTLWRFQMRFTVKMDSEALYTLPKRL
jgi:hypothetical protein